MMLLDTHVLFKYVTGDRKLGGRARSEIDRKLVCDEVFVSALSFWELAMLVAKDRLGLETTVTAFRAATLEGGIVERALDGEIAIAAGELPDYHRDPIDRLLVATAVVGGLVLFTADEMLLGWKLRGFRSRDASA